MPQYHDDDAQASRSSKPTPFPHRCCLCKQLQPRHTVCVTVPPVTLAHKVGPGLQDLQTRARRILAERNAEKAEENTWIGRMVAAESIGELDGLIKSRAA